MKKISALTLVLNNRCNFSCSYCPQRKGDRALNIEDVSAFLDILRPRLANEIWLRFYGGEPLLSWPLIENSVARLRKETGRRFRFALATNGSLLREEHVRFFRANRFRLVFSYDGLAQEFRDPGSVAAVEAALANLHRAYPDGYIIHSVFGPETVRLLAASMRKLMRRGHRRLQFALDAVSPWRPADLEALKEQLNRLVTSCLRRRRKTGKLPLENLKPTGEKGIFACFAGRDRLALLPDRTIWGCEMFHTLLGHDPQNPAYGQYCLGSLEGLASLPARALFARKAGCTELRQDFFFTEKRVLCGLCDDLQSCAVCPAEAALATGTPAVLPDWTCRIRRIARAAVSRFGGT